MDSEFKQFLDTIKRLGIKYTINWGPTKERWQDTILKAGYNLTALACVVISVGNTDFLFTNGQAHWTTAHGEEFGHGPRGLFLLSRNSETLEVQNRVAYDLVRDKLLKGEGLAAAKATYPTEFAEATRY